MRTAMLWGTVLLGAAIVIAAAAPPGETSGVATVGTVASRKIDAGVRRMAADIASDLSREGPTAWLRYLDNDGRFLMAVDGKLQIDGAAATKSSLVEFAKYVPHVEPTWTDLRVDPLAPGVASLAASYRETQTDTHGHSDLVEGYFTGVAMRTATGWKLRSAHWSSPVAKQPGTGAGLSNGSEP